MPLAIAIIGGWGSGKTTLMLATEKELARRGRILVLWLHPWRYGRASDVQSALVADLASQLSSEKALADKAKDFVVRFTYRGARALFDMGLEEMKRLPGGGVASVASGQFVDRLEETLRENSKGLNQDLAVRFAALVKDALSHKGLDQAVLMVDDLDRLLPHTSLQVVEAVTQYLFQGKVVWVVSLDKVVMEAGIRSVYGESYSARNYLDKVFQAQFPVPQYEPDAVLNYVFADEKELADAWVKTPVMDLLSAWCHGNVRNAIHLRNRVVAHASVGLQLPEDNPPRLMLALAICLQLSAPEFLEWFMQLEAPDAAKYLIDGPIDAGDARVLSISKSGTNRDPRACLRSQTPPQTALCGFPLSRE